MQSLDWMWNDAFFLINQTSDRKVTPFYMNGQIMQDMYLTQNELVSVVSIHVAFVKWFVKPEFNKCLSPLFVSPSVCRSSSLSLSPAQLRRETNFFKTPPISRGKHKISTNLTDGSRVGHVYKHLQEDESADMESLRRWKRFVFSLVLSC